MPDYKETLRGWRPDVNKDSLNKDALKSQVKGLVGRGDKTDQERRANHVAQPISSLRDPSSFGPPPRHVAATGSGTAIAPPPPRPPPRASPPSYTQQPSAQPRDAPPALPPRLPPRTNTAPLPPPQPTPPPPRSPAAPSSAASGYLNQGSISRLSSAGISVPGLGIGGGARTSPSTPSSSSAPAQSAEQSGPGSTSWAQKQSALRTAAAFKRDPGSVSMSDARDAAHTANNFRQRHGEQVASGVRAANAANEKYGVADRVGGLTSRAGVETGGRTEVGGSGSNSNNYGNDNGNDSSGGGNTRVASAAASAATGFLAKKKPPPPPPSKKKPDLPGLGRSQAVSGGREVDAPPPIPMATRPQF